MSVASKQDLLKKRTPSPEKTGSVNTAGNRVAAGALKSGSKSAVNAKSNPSSQQKKAPSPFGSAASNSAEGKAAAQNQADVAKMREAFNELLLKLCELGQVQDKDRAQILETGNMMVGDVAVALQLEEVTSHLKFYIDVGLPPDEKRFEIYEALLQQQMFSLAPCCVMPGVHPTSRHIILYCFSVLPFSDQEKDLAISFLDTAVRTARLLRENMLGLVEEQQQSNTSSAPSKH